MQVIPFSVGFLLFEELLEVLTLEENYLFMVHH